MKTLFWITFLVLIGLIWYTISIKMEFDETTGQLISCEATVDSLQDMIGGEQSSYIPPVIMQDNDALKMATAFKDNVGSTFDDVNGGIIPKETFTKIFEDGDVNGIGYNFGMDPDGAVVPGKPKAIFLVLSGVKMTRSATETDWTLRTAGTAKHLPGNWCPIYCISYTVPAEADGEEARVVTP
jgi:hypothetical protein